MVNKGRIHGKIRDFREIFLNFIKLDHEFVIEVKENGRFRKITQRQIHGIKITQFGSLIAEKSKSEVERNF